MLTKDLIFCKTSGTRLLPQFLPTHDRDLLEIAQRLLDIYRNGIGLRRTQLEEAIEQTALEYPQEAKPFQAIRKVVDDLAEFTSPKEADYPALRRNIFLASAKAIRAGNLALPLEQYRAQAEKGIGALASSLSLFHENQGVKQASSSELFPQPTLSLLQLYADLPDNDLLLRFPTVSPCEILERANIALVQGLLLLAESLEITIQDPSIPKLRRLLVRMRFQRLLATVEEARPIHPVPSSEKIGQTLKLTIDGPASILSQSRSYGFQLAAFFPAVCAMEHWRMSAKVQWKNKTRLLELDQDDKLVYHGATGAYEPPEIKALLGYFREKLPAGWSIVEEIPILSDDQTRMIVPDFTFRAPDGTLVYLELFHRWHASQLLPRLAYLDNAKEPPPLILGVDKALLANPEKAAQYNASPWFQNHAFQYRDFPTADKVLKALLGAL